MNALRTPSLAVFCEQPDSGADAPSGAPTIPHQRLANIIVVGHQKVSRSRRPNRLAYFLGQSVADPLIRIDFQNPITGAGLNTCIAPFAFDFPVSVDQPICVLRRNAF